MPLFAIESAYDSWSLPNILGIGCQAGGSLASCNAAQLAYIEQYHTNTSAVLKDIGKKAVNGFWAPSCSDHVYSTSAAYTSASFRIPAGSDFSLALCVENWATSKAVSHQHIDAGNWPSNKPFSVLRLRFRHPYLFENYREAVMIRRNLTFSDGLVSIR